MALKAAMKPKVLETLNTATLSRETEREGIRRTTMRRECWMPCRQPLLKNTHRRSWLKRFGDSRIGLVGSALVGVGGANSLPDSLEVSEQQRAKPGQGQGEPGPPFSPDHQQGGRL